MSQKTVTNRPERDRRQPHQAPYLVVLMDHERPLAAGLRHELDQVEVGRADSRAWNRRGRALSLALADTRLSRSWSATWPGGR